MGNHLARLALIAIGFFLLVVPGILFMLWFLFIDQVIAIEEKKDPFGRSKRLTKGYKGQLFFYGLITMVIVGLPVLILGTGLAVYKHWMLDTALDVAGGITYSLVTVFFTLAYLSIRKVKEAEAE